MMKLKNPLLVLSFVLLTNGLAACGGKESGHTTDGDKKPTVDGKLLDGFTDTLATNPCADGETYLALMFYSPTGLFYNAKIFVELGDS
jgi:hypothetical protein